MNSTFARKAPRRLAWGDIKLIGAAAVFLGPVGLWALFLIAPIGGIAFAILRQGSSGGVPFGPFIAYGVILSIAVFH